MGYLLCIMDIKYEKEILWFGKKIDNIKIIF